MKKWVVREKIDESIFVENPGVHPVILQILAHRGISDKDAVRAFLDHDYKKMHDPFLFQDMEAALELIISVIKRGKKIMIYGDYDTDGVTSSVILYKILNKLKADVDVYIPDRVSEGYGLNAEAIEKIASAGTALVITVDCGIRSQKEVALAKKLGMDVIITDHHLLPQDTELPQTLIINPANSNDQYPFPFLAGAGVAFKLATALISKTKLSDEEKILLEKSVLDLAAVGTIADCVSLLGENRIIVSEGLKYLNNTRNLGLRELINISGVNDRSLEAWNVGFQIGPRLNAASRMGHANDAFELLTTDSQDEAKSLANHLNDKNIDRQTVTEDIIEQVESGIDKDNPGYIIIGVCPDGEEWNEGVVGLVAGRICERHYRPTLIITHSQDRYKGSGRSIDGFDIVSALGEVTEHLLQYGGHPMACGFSLTREMMEPFREKLALVAQKKLEAVELIPSLKVDVALSFEDVNISLAEDLEKLAPYGQKNPQPVFMTSVLVIHDVMKMGANAQHIKFRFGAIWAISFGGADRYREYAIGDRVDIVYNLDINDFNGSRNVQMRIIDMRKQAIEQ